MFIGSLKIGVWRRRKRGIGSWRSLKRAWRRRRKEGRKEGRKREDIFFEWMLWRLGAKKRVLRGLCCWRWGVWITSRRRRSEKSIKLGSLNQDEGDGGGRRIGNFQASNRTSHTRPWPWHMEIGAQQVSWSCLCCSCGGSHTILLLACRPLLSLSLHTTFSLIWIFFRFWVPGSELFGKLPGRLGCLHWRNETGFSSVLYFLHCRRGIGTSIARTSMATKKRWARHWRQLWKQESLARTFLWHQNCGICAHWALSSYYLSSHSLLSLDLIGAFFAFWFS